MQCNRAPAASWYYIPSNGMSVMFVMDGVVQLQSKGNLIVNRRARSVLHHAVTFMECYVSSVCDVLWSCSCIPRAI
jgi:hypothetical protein